MTDYNDPALVFEHQLREHVRNARAKLEEFDAIMGETHNSWSIRYETEDGGMWIVETWRYGRTEGRAAELSRAVNMASSQAAAYKSAKVLPALLPTYTAPGTELEE